MGVGNSGRDPGEAAHLEEMENRPVRVRPPGTETDDHPHKHRMLEAERIDRERPMQGSVITFIKVEELPHITL